MSDPVGMAEPQPQTRTERKDRELRARIAAAVEPSNQAQAARIRTPTGQRPVRLTPEKREIVEYYLGHIEAYNEAKALERQQQEGEA